MWSLRLLRALPAGVTLMWLILAPYTKVEESFNMQATHDFLFVRDLGEFDHHTYPGAVPRTFLGSAALAAAAWLPVNAVALVWPTCDRLPALFIARGLLGIAHAVGLDRVAMQLRRLFGPLAMAFFLALTCSQFHQLFYASRTLPNTFALVGFLFGVAELLGAEQTPPSVAAAARRRGLRVLTATCVVFRADMAVFMGPLVLALLLTRRVPFWSTVFLGISTAAAAVAVSVCFDSLVWRRTLWPEGAVLWFNTVENKSSEWGTSPWWWYWGSALPRALLGATPLALAGVAAVRELRFLSATALIFVALFSILPHKELRFIFYAIPVLNAAAAVLAARLAAARRVWLAAFALLYLASAGATVVFGAASIWNYPTGLAIARLHETHPRGGHVHIDVASSMQGITRFQKNWCADRTGAPLWTYSKVPGAAKARDGSPFDFRVTFEPGNFSRDGFRTINIVPAFDGLDKDRLKGLQLWPPPFKWRNTVHVMRSLYTGQD
eukprot:TRINITY_DN4863_c0_g1_i1.p1 TRINITY_DN4863_c0_g1~~TRINITY_DN4863_c0_g1_i1.p1  ORF type:complete len:521 (+),score=163.73 TRINITY_DN4863_c0_g1_i1:79-1563(+)